ncbi:Protein of unknown function DUF2793 [uncultured Caudovirales phage]|uniref:Uncharacterized protein n=1 Tax=uncultured Caudovirales phage TaxID=2100421 RepID=A0A6J5N4V2_9CAUD|nr:Protein of unknown function DUF2793 [uncultured Caudovirales phage]
MGAKIHLYPLERFIFGDEDYYDIDYFDGLIYQTAKIKGSTIKAGIVAGLPSVDTIYNADGTINSDRTITGTNSNQLLFDQFRKFVFNTNPGPIGTPGYEINGGITGPFLRVKNAVTGVSMLDVSTAGVRINSEYTLPLIDGTAGQFIATDGNGNLSFVTSTASGDMLKSVYDPNNTGVVLSAHKLTVEFINKTGATLTKGTIVYLKSSSASGTHPEALKADALTEATSSKTIGAVFEDTLDNAIGKIVTTGEVDNLDTSAFNIGTKLWLSTTPGQVTATPPIQPNHTVFIGTVTRSQNVNGRILYTIQNGFELDELHNVLITSPTDGQTLIYDSTLQLWKNENPAPENQTYLDPVINVLNTPPTTPNTGDRYRIGTAPTGVWVGQNNKIAEYSSGTWVYTIPVIDNLVYQTTTATTFRFNGVNWTQWAGTPILQNGNTLGGLMRIGTNDNNNIVIKRNNVDVVAIAQNLFSVKGAGGNFGTFNFGSVIAFQNWNLPNKSGTIALLDDITGFISDVLPSEIRRGVCAISGTTTQGTFGGLTPINTGSIVAVTFGGTVKLPKFRMLTTTGSTNSTVGITFGNSGVVNTVGLGFRFVGSWIYSDQSSGGTNWFVPGARQFVGLATSPTLLAISSTVTLESLTNIIGIGSDATDVNLQIFHNGGIGPATKIDLGVNFPANKTGAVANGEAYQLELYNEFGQTSVKYRVRKLSDGTQVTGTIITNLPPLSMGPQIVRTSGATSQNVSIDLIQLTANTRE